MTQIFISYSRVDLNFVDKLYTRLQQMRPDARIWYDKAPHGLLGGDSWWDEIMGAIATSDIFIYVLSNESVQSKYCQAEFAEARRLQKRIITIQARDRTKITDDNLRDIQYVDMKNGVDDPDALARLGGALDRQMGLVKRRRALWQPVTSRPTDEAVPERPVSAPDVDTPTLTVPVAEQNIPRIPEKPWWQNPTFVIGAILVPIVATVIGGYIQNPDFFARVTPTPTEISVVPTSTDTPTLSATDVEGTIQAEMNAIVLADVQTAQANEMVTAEQQRQFARGTAAVMTLTATQSTPTPTIDVRATAGARLTQTLQAQQTQDAQIQFTAQALSAQQTQDAQIQLTAQAQQTLVAQQTQDAQIQLTAQAQQTLVAQQTQDAQIQLTAQAASALTATAQIGSDALTLARNFSGTRNADWTPIEQDFDGVTMVLVPAGCFIMGSNDGDNDEQPTSEQCFDEPFWIDKYEVTNAQYGSTGCSGYSSMGNQPRNCIDWFEAQEHCEARGGHLPTEAEWEYAARGMDNLMYPWGNNFVGDNVTYSSNSNNKTALVGRYPDGVSWVGAMDMSGNLFEWTLTIYHYYPYKDNYNIVETINTPSTRVLRGGSFANTEYNLRSAFRLERDPNLNNFLYGFRCARSNE